MITVLALDPTSLTLNVEGGFLSAGGNAGTLFDVFRTAYEGDAAAVKETLLGIDDPLFRARAAHFATCVWHEKRHFLDFLLTNYGALRMRQYFSIYNNFYFLISGAKQNENILWAPLSVYLDEVHRVIKEIPNAWPEPLAQMLLASSRLFAQDQESARLSSGEYAQFGGEAQFEALAWTYQIAAAPLLLGPDLAFEAQKDIVRFGGEQLRYRWMEYISDALGILPSFAKDNTYYFDYSLTLPLLYASLQVRAFGQTKNTPQSARSSAPSTRLFALVDSLSDMKLAFGELQISEAWDLMNKLCRKLWGRTAMEEIREDYLREEEFLQGFEDIESSPVQARECFKDFHRLRGTLIEKLESSPNLILDTKTFVTELLPKLQPLPILSNASGIDGDVPEDFDLIHGYYDQKENRDSGWWWAASPKAWPLPSPDVIALRARSDWLSAASNMAPLAKLMLNGRAHRTMIGPELLSLDRRLANAGIELRIDPQFAYPREDPRDQMETYYVMSGTRKILCDLCKEELKKPEGRFLQPWMFRHSVEMADLAIEGLTPPGASEEVGQRKFWKDWSPWVCCDSCFTRLSALPAFRRACEATFL